MLCLNSLANDLNGRVNGNKVDFLGPGGKYRAAAYINDADKIGIYAPPGADIIELQDFLCARTGLPAFKPSNPEFFGAMYRLLFDRKARGKAVTIPHQRRPGERPGEARG